MYGELHDEAWWSERSSTFGDRLAAAREAAEMDQKTLAKRLGVKVATLQGWEEDLSEPRANRLTMMSGVLNVSLPWLLTGEGEGVPMPDESALTADKRQLLRDIRAIRVEAQGLAERLGRLEKRLRAEVGADLGAEAAE